MEEDDEDVPFDEEAILERLVWLRLKMWEHQGRVAVTEHSDDECNAEINYQSARLDLLRYQKAQKAQGHTKSGGA